MKSRSSDGGGAARDDRRRVARAIGRAVSTGLALLVSFVLAAAGGLLAHVGLPAPRRLIEHEGNRLLASLPQDRVRLGHLRKMDPGGFVWDEITADVRGFGTVTIRDLTVDADFVRIGLGFVRGRPLIEVRRVYVGSVDAKLRPGEARRPSAPNGRSSGRGPEIRIDDFALARATVIEPRAGAAPLVLEASGIGARADYDSSQGISAAWTMPQVSCRGLLKEPVAASVEGAIRLPGDDERAGGSSLDPSRISAKISGRAEAAGIRASIAASIDAGRLEAMLDVPRIPAQSVQMLFPGAPVHDDGSLRLDAAGSTSHVEAHARLALGPGELSVAADVRGQDGAPLVRVARGQIQVQARRFDLRTFVPSARPSSLGLVADGTFARVDGGELEARIEGHTSESLFGTSSIPVARFDGSLQPNGNAEFHLRVDEPGAPLQMAASRSADGAIRGSLDASSADLAKVPFLRALGLGIGGRISLHAEGSVERGRLDARADLDAANLRAAGASVARATAQVAMSGPLDDPWTSARLDADRLARNSLEIAHLDFQALGAAHALSIRLLARGGKPTGSLDLRATADLENGPSLSALDVHLARNGVPIELAAGKVRSAKSSLAVEGLTILGLGKPIRIDGSFDESGGNASVDAPFVDFDRAAAFAGLDSKRLGGSIAVRAEGDIGGRTDRVRADIEARGFRIADVPRFDGRAQVLLDGRKAGASIDVTAGEIGHAELALDARLAGSARSPGSWTRATGSLAIKTGQVSIARACRRFDCPPLLASLASTAEIEADIERTGTRAAGGDTQVSLRSAIADPTGPLAALQLDGTVDGDELFVNRRLPLDSPLDARFSIASRRLEKLPFAVRIAGLRGTVEARGELRGTLRRPELALDVRGAAIQAESAGRSPPLDFSWTTSYRGSHGETALTVTARDRPVLRARANLEGDASAIAERGSSWTGGLALEANGFPLGALGAFTNHAIDGDLSGRITLRGIHENPVLSGQLSVPHLAMGREAIGPVDLGVEADAKAFRLTLRAGTPVRAELAAQGGLVWQNATFPSLDSRKAFDARLALDGFRLAALAPLLQADIEDLGGTMSASIQAAGVPRRGESGLRVTGEMTLDDVTFFSAALGRRMSHLHVHAAASPTGRVIVDRLEGDVGSGSFSGSASAQVSDGALQSAHARFDIPNHHAIPVVAEGVDYGLVWGTAVIDAVRKGAAVEMHVELPTLRFEATQQNIAKLQSTARKPYVTVLQPLDEEDAEKAEKKAAATPAPPPPAVGGGPPAPTPAVGGGPPAPPPRPKGAMKYVIAFDLGHNVGVRRGDMRVELGGSPVLVLDDTLHVDGFVRVLGGRVSAMGKTFTIDRGIVRFGGADSSDPSLDIDATNHTSGVAIMIHVGGSAKKMKIDLKSDPPRSQSELLALLAGIPAGDTRAGQGPGPSPQQPEGNDQSSGAAGAAAAAAGGAVISSGLNQLLAGTILPIQANVSSSQGTTKTSATVNVSDRIRVEYIRQFGEMKYGQTPDANSVALDWRFAQRWLLRTLVGDRGTTVFDLLWQRWY